MAEHEASAPQIDKPAVHHETTDVDLLHITYWGGALVLLVVLMLSFLIWLFGHFNKRETRLGHNTVGIPAAAPVTTPPQLQISPRSELAEMRAAEEKTLHSYGWVDKEKGIARIPIERAMEIITQRGLPATQKK